MGLRPIKHGTIGGYMTHIRRDEPMCDRCREAWSDYYRERYRQKKLKDRKLAAKRAFLAQQRAAREYRERSGGVPTGWLHPSNPQEKEEP